MTHFSTINNDGFLIYGSNCLFNQRIYHLFKRNKNILNIDFEYKFDYQNNIEFNFKNFSFLKNFLKTYNLQSIILTDEIIHVIKKENDFLKFLSLISQLSKSKQIKLIYISITEPLPTDYKIQNNYILSTESKKVKSWKKSIIEKIDLQTNLIFNLKTFITPTQSKIQKNLIFSFIKNKDLKFKKNSFFNLSMIDELIYDLESSLDLNGKIKAKAFNEKFNLNDIPIKLNEISKNFCSEREKVDDKILSYIFNQINCSVELLYRKKGHNIVSSRSVSDWRIELGKSLYSSVPKEIFKKIDYIVPVPETGKNYAQGLSIASGVKYVEAFYKKADIGRSFDIIDSQKRRKFIDSKLGIIQGIVKNKNIGIVDEAVFTGATLKIACKLLDDANVNEIYIFIPSSFCKFRCNYNMRPNRTLLLEYVREENLSNYFDVNGIFFQNYSAYSKIMNKASFKCLKCFN